MKTEPLTLASFSRFSVQYSQITPVCKVNLKEVQTILDLPKFQLPELVHKLKK